MGLGFRLGLTKHMQAPLVLKRCAEGRGAAGGALALVYTQVTVRVSSPKPP